MKQPQVIIFCTGLVCVTALVATGHYWWAGTTAVVALYGAWAAA